MTKQKLATAVLSTRIHGETGNSGSIFDVMRHELLYILWALMELAIVTPLILAFAPWAKLWPAGSVVLLLLFLMLIPFNLARLMSSLNIKIENQRVILAVCLVLAILVSWRLLLYSPRPLHDVSWLGDFLDHIGSANNPYRIRDLTLFLAVTFVYWRGLSLAGRKVDINEIGFRMRLGILLIFILVAVMAGSLLPWSVTPFILLFFFSSLMAIVLTRVEQLELDQTGFTFPITIRWLSFVVAASGLVAFTTGLLAGTLSNDSVVDVVGWFRPLFEAINAMVTVLISIIVYLLSPLILLLNWIFNEIVGSLDPNLQEALEQLELNPQQDLGTQLSDDLISTPDISLHLPTELLTVLVMLVIVLVVSLAIGQMVRRLRRTSDIQLSSHKRPVFDTSPRSTGIRRMLFKPLESLRRWRMAASIRTLYRQMCYTAAQNGFPRAESETPYEYLPTLQQAWPNNVDQVDRLTEAYIHVHYGEFPEDPDELAILVAAWKALESTPVTGQGLETEDVIVQKG